MSLLTAAGFGCALAFDWEPAFPLGFFVGLLVAPMVPSPGGAWSVRLPAARSGDEGADASEPRG